MTVFLAFCAHVLLSAVGTEIATVIWGTDRFTSAALRKLGTSQHIMPWVFGHGR